jgi:hypothetical protein
MELFHSQTNLRNACILVYFASFQHRKIEVLSLIDRRLAVRMRVHRTHLHSCLQMII